MIPSSGDTLDPAQGYVLDATASPGVTQVQIEIEFEGTITASYITTPTIYGWIAVVPGTPPACPPFPFCKANSLPGSVASVASYSGGVFGGSPAVNVTLIVYGPPS